LAARTGRLDDDAKVWADCVVASLRGLDGPPPGRWLFVGVSEPLLALPSALAATIGEIRGDTPDAAPLAVSVANRIAGEVRSEDLIAAGAAALAAVIYDPLPCRSRSARSSTSGRTPACSKRWTVCAPRQVRTRSLSALPPARR